MLEFSKILGIWNRMKLIPGGRLVFSKMIRKVIPYSGSIGANVEELRPGYARVSMKDHHVVRNHLQSIHAMALANLAELASGIAFLASLPPYTRAILVKFSITYEKKARGNLTAECYAKIPETNERSEWELDVVTHDLSGDVVTRARATWLIAPNKSAKE